MTHNKKKRHILRNTLISLLIVFIVGSLAAGDYMIKYATKRSSNATDNIQAALSVSEDPEQAAFEERVNAERKRIQAEAEKWSDETPGETITITSFDGLKLNALVHKQDSLSHRWMIGVHGFHGSMKSMFPFAKRYYENGYNVLTPDLRASGSSEGEYIGMGVPDKRDIIQWINTIIETDPEAEIVLHGISMGASTIMMAAGEDDLPDNVKVIVEDCGYSTVWKEYTDKLRQVFNIPAFPVLYTANIMCRIHAGYFFSDGSCIKALKKNTTPMFFAHGDADDYNPFYMLEEVYEADACSEKEKLVIKRARHTDCSYAEPETYWNSVWNFINKYM